MPRRSPPSALLLFQGPLPPRNKPKHTFPSIPQPAFYPNASLTHKPAMKSRARQPAVLHLTHSQLPLIDISLASSMPNSPTSSTLSSPSSAPSLKAAKGPWDHSRSISIQLHVDVDNILAMPKPVAIYL